MISTTYYYYDLGSHTHTHTRLFCAQMLDAAAPGAGAAAGDASAVRQDGAHRIIAFALETWNHNTLALALLHAATTPEELFHSGDWKADLAEVLVLAGWRDAKEDFTVYTTPREGRRAAWWRSWRYFLWKRRNRTQQTKSTGTGSGTGHSK